MNKHSASVILLLAICFGQIDHLIAQTPIQNLVAYYPFDGNSNDASGNGNDAINTNAVLAIDRFGIPNSAYDFNGIDAYLEINNDFDFPERTINLWFYIDSIDRHGAIYDTYDTDNPLLQYGQTKVFVTSEDGLDTLESAIGMPHDKVAIERRQWHMLTLVRNYNVTTSLLNCSVTNSRLNSNNTSLMGPSGTRIGTTVFYDRFFGGRVDDVRVYDRALTEDEITELYKEGNPNIKTNAPSICPMDAAVMTPTCADACVVCDINGFTGRNVADDFGELPPGFAGECTLLQHKAAWIAFIAGSTNLKISMSVSNCTTGSGLELGIYAGTECGDFRRISNCHGGATQSPIREGQPRELEVFEPLEIGQYYYIIMDATPNGAEFETCDWTLTVLEGSTEIFPLNTSGDIIGQSRVCPDLETSYYTAIDTGATEYIWTLDGVNQEVNNDSINITFPSIGAYNLCVQASNACQFPDPTCRTIEVYEVPITTIDTMVCASDCVVIADTMICDPGTYTRRYRTDQGCDSLIRIDYTDIPTAIIEFSLNICEGDTLYVGEQPYFDSGIYQERLSTVDQCDSIVKVDLFVVQCDIESSSSSRSVSCHGASDGRIIFNVDQGTAPFTYSWERIGGSQTGSGRVGTVAMDETISRLLPGLYAITVNDNFGNIDIILEEVVEPEPIRLSIIISDYNGQDISCVGADDGSLTAVITGGQEPYQLLWNTGENSPSIVSLSPDLYTLVAVDDLGCPFSGSMVVTEPMPIAMMVDQSNPNCDGPTTGSLTVKDVIGGTPDYQYSLDSATWQDSPVFEMLGEQSYNVYLKDANDCSILDEVELMAPEIPAIDLGADQSLALGDSIQFQLSTNDLTGPQIMWSPDLFLSCSDCPDPYAHPPSSLDYVVTVQSIDDCIDSDTIFIDVQKFRRFYAPTAFTPNQDGVNDLFFISGGPEVLEIQKLNIYDRWGSKIYEIQNLPSSIQDVGWDGRFNNRQLNSGTYIWSASILFIDGEIINYSGEFSLIR